LQHDHCLLCKRHIPPLRYIHQPQRVRRFLCLQYPPCNKHKFLLHHQLAHRNWNHDCQRKKKTQHTLSRRLDIYCRLRDNNNLNLSHSKNHRGSKVVEVEPEWLCNNFHHKMDCRSLGDKLICIYSSPCWGLARQVEDSIYVVQFLSPLVARGKVDTELFLSIGYSMVRELTNNRLCTHLGNQWRMYHTGCDLDLAGRT